MQKRFWHNIQLVRLIATFGIVIIHLRQVLAFVGIPEYAVGILRLGTDSFLVVSAFLTCFIMLSRSRGSADYLWGRLIRILPAYWIVTLFAVAFKYAAMSRDSHDTVSRVLYSLTLLPYENAPIIYPAWSLALILEFACIVSIAFAISRKRGTELSIAGSVAMAVVGYINDGRFEFLTLYCDPRMLNFATGAAIALFIKRSDALDINSGSKTALKVLCFCLIATSLALSAFWAYGPIDLSRRFLLPAATMLIFSVALLDLLGISAKSRWIDSICNLSFMIYLTHFMWIIVLEKLMTLLPISLIYALIVMTPAICAFQALVFYRLIERPLSNFLDRKTKGWFSVNRVATAVPAN